MSILDAFRRKKNRSAAVAKDRLQVIIAHERSRGSAPDYLLPMRAELLEVIRKYVAVDDDAVNMQIERDGDYEVLELNVTLPESEGRPLNTR